MENGMTAKNWAQIIGLTCAAFIFNTSEFMPIGLLTDIAQDFAITEAHAGTLISAYAWVVMLLSLPLMILVSKLELRKLMLWIILLFGICQILSSLSEGYAMLMLSRIGVACTHAIFWSIVSPLAVKLVPHSHRALALSMIVTGTSIAMIFGLPLGRMVGLTIGWRMTFLGVGILAFLTFAYLAFSLPKVPSNGGFSLHKLPELLKNPILTGLYILTFGHCHLLLCGVQLHRAVPEASRPSARQLDYRHADDFWRHGHSGQFCLLQILPETSLSVPDHDSFMRHRMPGIVASRLVRLTDGHPAVCRMGHGCHGIQRIAPG